MFRSTRVLMLAAVALVALAACSEAPTSLVEPAANPRLDGGWGMGGGRAVEQDDTVDEGTQLQSTSETTAPDTSATLRGGLWGMGGG